MSIQNCLVDLRSSPSWGRRTSSRNSSTPWWSGPNLIHWSWSVSTFCCRTIVSNRFNMFQLFLECSLVTMPRSNWQICLANDLSQCWTPLPKTLAYRDDLLGIGTKTYLPGKRFDWPTIAMKPSTASYWWCSITFDVISCYSHVFGLSSFLCDSFPMVESKKDYKFLSRCWMLRECPAPKEEKATWSLRTSQTWSQASVWLQKNPIWNLNRLRCIEVLSKLAFKA